MKACPATVASYLAGKARTAVLLERDGAALMAEYGDFLEEHDECFFVPLTGACLKKLRVAVVDHLTGTAFLAAKQAWEETDYLEDEAVEEEEGNAGVATGKFKSIKTPKGKHKFFESPAASKTPSGKAAWEKQLGSIEWQSAVDETVAPCKTPSH